MADKLIKMARGLDLPAEVATMAGLIAGQRGTGKTSTAVREVEQCHDAGIPSVIIDPTGVWWGLRHGTRPLDHVLFGGFRGAEPDLPLRDQDGPEIARLVAEERVSAVLGLRHMRKGPQIRFVAEFLEDLYHLNTMPLLVIMDESWRFAPAQMNASDRGGYGARCLGATVDVVGLGRAGGLGIRLITQRMAKVHADAREQCELVIAHRLMGTNDRKAISGWLEGVGDLANQERAAQLLTRIPQLELGQAAVYMPTLKVFGEFTILPKRTYDSSATPTGTAAVIEPKGRSHIDLEAVGARLAAAVEEAKANDPKALRKRVAELERSLAAAEAQEAPPAEPVTVEVPAIPGDVRTRVNALVAVAEGLAACELESAYGIALDVVQAAQDLRSVVDGVPNRLERPNPGPNPVVPARPRRTTPVVPAAARSNQDGGSVGSNGDLKLGRAHRAILTVLAQHPEGRSKRQLALQAGYSENGGGFNNPLGALRSAGYVNRGEPIAATGEGLAALGQWDPIPTGPALLDHWLGQGKTIGGKAGRAILEQLAAVYPSGFAKDELAERCGYSPEGGGFNNPLGRLRTLGLVDRGAPVCLTPEFGEAIR